MTDRGKEPASDVPVPRRYWWLRRLMVAGGCFVVGLVVLRLAWGWEANRRLAAEIARYRSAGQPVYAREFDAVLDAVEDEDNAALLYEKAMTGLVRASASGVEIDDFVASSGLFVEKQQDVLELLEANRPVLVLAREARGRPQVAWSARIGGVGGAMPMMGGGQRALAMLLWFASTKQRLDSDCAAATETMRDSLRLSKAIDSHPTVISNLVAGSVYGMTFTLIEDMTSEVWMESARDVADSGVDGTVWETVGEALAELLDEDTCRQAAIRARYGDRANYLEFIRSMPVRGPGAVLPRGPGSFGPWDRLLAVIDRPRFLLDTIEQMRFATLTSAALAEHNGPQASLHIPSSEGVDRTLLGSLTRPLSYTVSDRSRSARVQIQSYFQNLARQRMAAIALAILLFEHDHGRRPAELVELVPRYLPRVPMDPFAADGAEIRYRRDEGHPVLYSVGRNGVDDGGVMRLRPSRAIDFETSDILFDLGGRKDRWAEVSAPRPSGEAVDHDQDPEDGERQGDEQQSSQGEPE